MNNDNEPPSLMQFWSHADEKLVVNKSWPKLIDRSPTNGGSHEGAGGSTLLLLDGLANCPLFHLSAVAQHWQTCRGGEIGGAGGAQAPPNFKAGGLSPPPPPHFLTHNECDKKFAHHMVLSSD